MADWITNQYFPFKLTNNECIQIATNLLNSYSLTRGCLKTLGNELRDQLEFGFFEEGSEIIVQGESGRDVFLLCTGVIDVLVGGQVVVNMNSPALVGDKGIVSANSQRAASIKISSEKQALVIKIPMESFIRNFKDTSIPDESFSQEMNIFENVFQNVQERLFEYIYLQKTLWEQASNAIQVLNQQIYAKQIDNKIDTGWDVESWSVVQSFLKANYNITWPAGVPINSANLNTYLKKYFEVKYKDTSKSGALTKRKLEWRSSLFAISSRVLKNISDEKKPFPPLDLELFNPNIYRMRLTGLLNQLEKRYSSKKVKQDDKSKLNPAMFFGKGETSNVFNLSQYLDYFSKTYKVKNSRRLLAQVGQKCALIAAECENNFNSSVVTMQKFLEKVKEKNISLGTDQKKSEIDPSLVKSWINTLNRGIKHFRDSSNTIDGQTLGIIKFSETTYPNFTNLLKSHRVKFTREQMSVSFSKLIGTYQFQAEYLSKTMLNNSFHFCGIERGDTIPESEILNNYWFPMSGQTVLSLRGKRLVDLKACVPIGGNFWQTDKQDNPDEVGPLFSLSTEDDSMFLVLPKSNLPWANANGLDAKALVERCLPLMQWLIDKEIKQILYLQACRDRIVEEWMEIRNGIICSQKIAVFEQKPLKLPKADNNRIIAWLNSKLGMNLDVSEGLVSSKLSKRIYNFFLHSATIENPELSIEQRGNQAYTKWRNLLFEIVDQIPALNKVVSQLPGEDPMPVLNVLAKQLTPVLSPFMKDTWEKQNPITSGTPNLNLLSILHPDKHNSPEDSTALFETIHDIFLRNAFQLVMEINQHQETLNKMYEERGKSDSSATSNSVRVDIMHESIQNLINILEKMTQEK